MLHGPRAKASEAAIRGRKRYYRVSFQLLLISDLHSYTDCGLAVQGLDANSHFTWRKVSHILIQPAMISGPCGYGCAACLPVKFGSELGPLYQIRPSLNSERVGRKGFLDLVCTERQLRKSICSRENGFQTYHYRRTSMSHFSSLLRKPTAEPQSTVLGWTLLPSARSIQKYLDAGKAALEIGECKYQRLRITFRYKYRGLATEDRHNVEVMKSQYLPGSAALICSTAHPAFFDKRSQCAKNFKILHFHLKKVVGTWGIFFIFFF